MLDLMELPVLYYVAAALTLALIIEAAIMHKRAWSRPAIAIYMTIGVWYLGDMLYNGAEDFYYLFNMGTVNTAFGQVIVFLVTYRALLLLFGSMYPRDDRPALPASLFAQEKKLLIVSAVAWLMLAAMGVVRVDYDFASILFPPLSADPAYPWNRGGVGQGLDFMVSFLEYIQIAVCGLIGVLAVLSRRPAVRGFAIALFILALQMYLYQRARNRMLAVLLPGMLAFLLLSPVKLWVKAAVATGAFFAISTWFLVIVGTRDTGGTVLDRVSSADVFDASSSSARHLGLNMLEELCWHDVLMDEGLFNPDFGEGYFDQVVTIVPRAIWPDKPYIGVKYATARGFGGAAGDMGVFATISSGIIGQGVANFGPILGAPGAAAICVAWTMILAAQWNRRGSFLRLGLFLIGMGLTYNMGRDITLQVLFPFLFAYMGVRVYEIVASPREKLLARPSLAA